VDLFFFRDNTYMILFVRSLYERREQVLCKFTVLLIFLPESFSLAGNSHCNFHSTPPTRKVGRCSPLNTRTKVVIYMIHYSITFSKDGDKTL